MNLAPKKMVELTEADIAEHSVWASFYEPDELDLLVGLGFDREQVLAALGSIEYSDEYIFPLPKSAAALPFKYIFLSAQAQTPGGNSLVGLRSSVSLSLLYKAKTYHFNRALVSLSNTQAKELAAALSEEEVFPLSIFIPALAKNELFSLSGSS